MSLTPRTIGIKITIILLFVFVLATIFFFKSKNENESVVFDLGTTRLTSDSDKTSIVPLLSSVTTSTSTSEGIQGSYETYSKEKVTEAGEGVRVVLFFNASWCPTCQSATKEFTSANIDSKLKLLSVDYDTHADLKKKYLVTYQHTFVEVDRDGNMLKKWSGGGLSKIMEMLNI